MTPNLIQLPVHADARGELSVMEFTATLPFVPVRQFVVRGVPPGAIRGQHANRRVHELLICVAGSLVVTMDNGRERSTTRLHAPDVALHLPNMVWSEQKEFSADAVMVVLASLPYDGENYIRDYGEYLQAVARPS